MDPAVASIVEAATAVDGAAPLDEATLIALADGQGHLRVQDGGLLFIHGDELSLVVHPEHRRHGVATALLQDAPPGPLFTAAVPFLSFSTTAWLAWAGAAVWGIGLGMHESTMRAAVADLVVDGRHELPFSGFTHDTGGRGGGPADRAEAW